MVTAMTTAIPDLDTLLSRHAVSKALEDRGFPVPPATLATMASRGGGPPFHRFGTRVLYRWGPALAWAQARLRGPISSTSQADVGLADWQSLGRQRAGPLSAPLDAVPIIGGDDAAARSEGLTSSAAIVTGPR
jgi:hypothetical protein